MFSPGAMVVNHPARVLPNGVYDSVNWEVAWKVDELNKRDHALVIHDNGLTLVIVTRNMRVGWVYSSSVVSAFGSHVTR